MIAEKYRLSYWAKIISDRKESGLSIKAFCENAGFHTNSYYYWQRKLREAACSQLTGMQLEPTETFLIPQGFTEVKLPEPATQPEIACPSQLSVEVYGIQITTDSTYPVNKLAALLRELVQPC